MKKRLQGLGFGLFLAGAVFTLLTQFTDFQQTKDRDEIKRLQNQLLAAEQEIATLNEAVAQASIKDEAVMVDKPNTEETEQAANQEPQVETSAKTDEDLKKSDSEANDQDKKEPNQITTGTILIYEGVSLYDIGKQAEDQGVVNNGRELELYLYKPEYARYIQKGQFELRSDMSFEEMALTLTGKQ